MQISVTDPIDKTTLFGSFTTYKITTITNHPHFDNGHVTVTRRYSDFLHLHYQLNHKLMGVIIPPLPSKQTIGRFDSIVIEHRIFWFEQFLNYCSQSQSIMNCCFFISFLQSSVDNTNTEEDDINNEISDIDTFSNWIDSTAISLNPNLQVGIYSYT
jgi:sorting nexin-1/2